MANQPLILLIEDEPPMRRFLRAALGDLPYRLIEADTMRSGLAMAASHAPDVILLDLGLPDGDGLELVQRLREWSKAPVIVLSARDRETAKIAALDAGADDYVEKPFGVGELLARIRTALRHRLQRQGLAPLFKAGQLTLDFARRDVRIDGRPLDLSPLEYALLEMLARHAGRVLTHRQLLTAIWGIAHAEDVQYLRVYIGHLRQKLGPEAGAYLRTEVGVGYRLFGNEDQSTSGGAGK